MIDLTELKTVLKPMDVIMTVPHWSWSYLYQPWKIPMYLVGKEIQKYQKETWSDWFSQSVHTRLYFDDDHIFEVTFPKSQWTTLQNIANEDLRILHYVPFEFKQSEIDMARFVASPLLGKWYDVLDLLAFYIAHVYSHSPEQENVISDLVGVGKGNLVCSSGVRSVYEGLRKRLEAQNDMRMKRLFPKPDGSDTLIEMTTPSHFDNSADFWLRACFKNAKSYYIAGK